MSSGATTFCGPMVGVVVVSGTVSFCGDMRDRDVRYPIPTIATNTITPNVRLKLTILNSGERRIPKNLCFREGVDADLTWYCIMNNYYPQYHIMTERD